MSDFSSLTPATLTLRNAAVDGRGIKTTETTYAVSDSGSDAPTTGWQSVMPEVDTGQYLWTRVYITYTDGENPTTYYTCSLQGKDGVSSFKSIVFKRSSSTPSAPTGGSFTAPVPDDWSDGIPAEDGNPCYMTTRIFSSTGESPQTAAWTTPQLCTDTADFDICFYPASSTTPADPATHGSQGETADTWHDTALTTDEWMATATRENGGEWSAWSIVKIKGEKGVDGLTAQPNIIDGSGFARGTSAWTTQNSISLAKTGGVWAQGIALNPYSVENSADIDLLEQTIYSTSGAQLIKPSTWYTLSFYMRIYTSYSTNSSRSHSVKVETYVHRGTGSNNPVDDTTKGYVDGVETELRGDCYQSFSASLRGVGTSEWVRHTITFKTSAELDQVRLLFRKPIYSRSSLTPALDVWKLQLSCVKLEESEEATPWQLSENDRVGDTGAQGLQGCICRISEWAEGVEYHNDTAKTDDSTPRYIDIVVTKDSTTGKVQTAYQCATTHTSDADKKPSTESTDYWTKFNNMQPVYTPLLLADNAAISFVQGNQLLILDEDGNVCAGLAGAEYPLWVGATSASESDTAGNVTYAPFVIKQNGSFMAAAGNMQVSADGDLAMAGFIKKKKLTITKSNRDVYLTNVGKDTEPRWTFNIERIGGWVSLEGEGTGDTSSDTLLTEAERTFYFLATSYATLKAAGMTDDTDIENTMDAMRCYYGQTIIVYNNITKASSNALDTTSQVTINGVYVENTASGYLSAGNTSFTAVSINDKVTAGTGKYTANKCVLKSGQWLAVECRVIKDSDSKELICWVVRDAGSKTSGTTPTTTTTSTTLTPTDPLKPNMNSWTLDNKSSGVAEVS